MARTTLDALIEQLTDLRDELGTGDVEVRLAQQPRWAFEYSIGEVEATEAVLVGDPDEDGEPATEADARPPVVYIAEGSQLGYLPAQAAEALGWGR